MLQSSSSYTKKISKDYEAKYNDNQKETQKLTKFHYFQDFFMKKVLDLCLEIKFLDSSQKTNKKHSKKNIECTNFEIISLSELKDCDKEITEIERRKTLENPSYFGGIISGFGNLLTKQTGKANLNKKTPEQSTQNPILNIPELTDFNKEIIIDPSYYHSTRNTNNLGSKTTEVDLCNIDSKNVKSKKSLDSNLTSANRYKVILNPTIESTKSKEEDPSKNPTESFRKPTSSAMISFDTPKLTKDTNTINTTCDSNIKTTAVPYLENISDPESLNSSSDFGSQNVKPEKSKKNYYKSHIHKIWLNKLLTFISIDENVSKYFKEKYPMDCINTREDFIENFSSKIIYKTYKIMLKMVNEDLENVLDFHVKKSKLSKEVRQSLIEDTEADLKDFLSSLLSIHLKRLQPSEIDIKFQKNSCYKNIEKRYGDSTEYEDIEKLDKDLQVYLELIGKHNFRMEFQLSQRQKLHALQKFNDLIVNVKNEVSDSKTVFIGGDEFFPCLIFALQNCSNGIIVSECKVLRIFKCLYNSKGQNGSNTVGFESAIQCFLYQNSDITSDEMLYLKYIKKQISDGIMAQKPEVHIDAKLNYYQVENFKWSHFANNKLF